MNNEKKQFFLKLIPPRPDFSKTMLAEERNIMQQHVDYWTGLLGNGNIIVYGPVSDPEGDYGIGIVEVNSNKELQDFIENDPATKLCKYEVYPMRAITPKIKGF